MSDNRLGERERALIDKLIDQTRAGKLHWITDDVSEQEFQVSAGESEFFIESVDRDDRAPFVLIVKRGGKEVAYIRTLQAHTAEDDHLNRALESLFWMAKRSLGAAGPEVDEVLRDLEL